MTNDAINVITTIWNYIYALMQTQVPGTTLTIFNLFFGVLLFKAVLWFYHNVFNINPMDNDLKGGKNGLTGKH